MDTDVGSFAGDYAQAVALGSQDGLFVVGHTQGSLGGVINRGDDAFITHFDSAGTLLWTRLLGTAYGDYASAIAVDTKSQQGTNDGSPAGDIIYLAGASFGPWESHSYQGGSSDAFIVALDAQGNSLWTRQIGSRGDDWARAVAVGQSGEVYVAGEVGAEIEGSSFAGGPSDVFLRKYFADGTLAWTKLLGSAGSDTANAISVAEDGSIYVIGTTYGSLDGGLNLGGDDVFVAKYLPNGALEWVLQTGTPANDAGLAIATLTGSLVIAGYSEGSFGGQTNKGMSDTFVANVSIFPAITERPSKSKYFILENSGGNLFDFDLDYPEISLSTEMVELVGSINVDNVRIHPGTVVDFTFSSSSSDKVYLPGNFSDYRTTLAGTVITLTRGNGNELESVSVNTSSALVSNDLLVFADGFINSGSLANYLRTPEGTQPPFPNSGETYLNPAPPATPGHPLGSLAKAFAMKDSGSTFAPMVPGVSLIAIGSIDVDKVYVADGTVIDATALGPSSDEIYFRGAWGDYVKQFAAGANTFTLSRSIAGLSEKISVAGGLGALDDNLIFTDGIVSSRNALLALQNNPQVPIKDVPGYQSGKTTPGVAVYMVDSPLDNLTNLDPRSNLTLKFSGSIQAQPGKAIRIVNDGGSDSNKAGFRGETEDNSMTIQVTDASQVTIVDNVLTINPARDLDLANSYHIEIDGGAFKGANGLPSPPISSPSRLNFETVRPGVAVLNPSAPAESGSPSMRMTNHGQLTASQRWLDIESLGSTSGSNAVTVSLAMGSYALAFRDYADKAPSGEQGFDGVQVRGFWVSATDFGADDLIYIDNQGDQPNDLAQSYILNTGNAPSRVQFAADTNAPAGNSLAGWIDVTLVGSMGGFSSVFAWGQKLGLPVDEAPMISG